MLVIAVAISLALLAFQDRERAFYERSAQQLGMDLYQYNNAVRAWLATRVGDPGDPNVAAARGTYTGVAWLKSDSCDDGTIDGDGYLNCGFSETTRLGDLSFTTIVSDDPDDFTTEEGRECVQSGGRICAETSMDPLEVGGEPAPDLAGLAALTASGGAASNLIPTFAATDAAFNVDVDTAAIVMVAGQNGADDVWLRTAGDNRMAGPVSWINDREDPASGSRADHDGGSVSPEDERELRGVSRIYNFSGADLPAGTSAALVLGRASLDPDPSRENIDLASQFIASPDVIVDADQGVLGDLEVRGSIYAAEDAQIDGDVTIGDSAGDGGELTARDSLRTPEIEDLDDDRFGLDPNDESVLRELIADRLVDRNDDNYLVDPDGESVLDDVLLGARGRNLSEAIYDIAIVNNNTLVSKPDCSEAVGDASIFTSVSGFGRGNEPRPVGAVFTWAENASASQWRVRLAVFDRDGWHYPSGSNARIQVVVKCG